jgi:dihydroorotate dehydrogenase
LIEQSLAAIYRHMGLPFLIWATRNDPEVAHERMMQLLAGLGHLPPLLALLRRISTGHRPPHGLPNPLEQLEQTVFGVRFPNPVGLAAGYDKDGTAIPALAAMGFGFLEIGTVTWHPQPGNPRPRIFRLPAARAIINRMGFNNQGAEAMAARLQQSLPLPVPIGISLGKSRITPVDDAIDDYCASFRALAPYGDFFSINVSSPNTPGLRSLQDRHQLSRLLGALRQEAIASSIHSAHSTNGHPPPLLVKIAPDLSEHAISEVLEVCDEHALSGIIATNTTMVGPNTPRPFCEQGGMSGRPLTERSREVVRFISRETGGRLPIIGVGGILTADDALRMMDAGARLVQLYTGLIYEGPTLIRSIHQSLIHREVPHAHSSRVH